MRFRIKWTGFILELKHKLSWDWTDKYLVFVSFKSAIANLTLKSCMKIWLCDLILLALSLQFKNKLHLCEQVIQIA